MCAVTVCPSQRTPQGEQGEKREAPELLFALPWMESGLGSGDGKLQALARRIWLTSGNLPRREGLGGLKGQGCPRWSASTMQTCLPTPALVGKPTLPTGSKGRLSLVVCSWLPPELLHPNPLSRRPFALCLPGGCWTTSSRISHAGSRRGGRQGRGGQVWSPKSPQTAGEQAHPLQPHLHPRAWRAGLQLPSSL